MSWPAATGQTGFSSSAEPKATVGEYRETKDGRGFRYALAGELLVAGTMLQTRVEEATHDALVVVTGALGSNEITLTTEASTGALTLNEYADGYVITDTTPGEGYTYQILSHPVVAALANGIIKLRPADSIQVVLSTATRVTLIFHPYSKVIIFPATTATGVCVGAAIYPIASGEYGWIQTHGTAAVLTIATPITGSQMTCVGTTPGGTTVISGVLPLIGHIMETGRAGVFCPHFLCID
jgi:hypothetical protein